MSYYETEAIILDSFPLSETGKVVAFLTPHYGVLRGVARGARNPRSKFSGALELFSNVEVTFSHKERELVRIDKVELKKSYFSLVSEPLLLPFFAFIADTIIKVVPQGTCEELIYRMVKACVEATERHPNGVSLIKLYFSIWTLKLSGYLPSWESCRRCKRSLFDEVFFTADALCLSCYRLSKSEILKNNVLLGKRHLQILQLALKLSPQDFMEAVKDAPESQIRKLHEATEKLLQFTIEDFGQEFRPR